LLHFLVRSRGSRNNSTKPGRKQKNATRHD
jgi:hypothetical protein